MSVEETKDIREMSHEEVAAALPKLREEAARVDARIQEAMQRLAQTADLNTYVEVHDDHLLISAQTPKPRILAALCNRG